VAAPSTHFGDGAQEVPSPDKGVLSRTRFGVASSFAQGEAKLALGDDTEEARPGTWVHLPTGPLEKPRRRDPSVALPIVLAPA
jgi:hypothetical protein